MGVRRDILGKLISAICVAIIIAVSVRCCFLFGHGYDVRTDTIRSVQVIHHTDTLYLLKRFSLPTLLYTYGKSDTMVIRGDTALPYEQKVYGDTMYTAWVSGIDASLDSIHIQEREVRVNDTIREYVELHTIERKKDSGFSFGLTIGYGATKDGLSPFVGIGVTKTFSLYKKRNK